MERAKIASFSNLQDRKPTYAIVGNVDLVVVRYDKEVHVLYGRCLHRGVLLADGHVDGGNLICSVHNWEYQLKTGISSFNNKERLKKFNSWVEDDTVYIDKDEIAAWEQDNPQTSSHTEKLGRYYDPRVSSPEEPHVKFIQELAAHGLSHTGNHGPIASMGVPRHQLPCWDDLQFMTAQLHTFPQLDDVDVGTDIVIGPASVKPLRLKIPIFITDMSFGSLSAEAKVSLARGAEMAGTGICSGEGGMLPEEQQENSRYFYELASGRFGFSYKKLRMVQAFHFKGGQGAKTGTGGYLPADKVTEKIAEVRNVTVGQAVISPARFPYWKNIEDFRNFADGVREITGGIPIGFKLSAQHIEEDLEAAIKVGVDYIILDGRGGGTGAAPTILRDHISIPTLPAIARARRHLDLTGHDQISLIVTGGLRTPADFAKALALGADGVAIGNAAIQAIGCLGMRACHTDNCPVGIATQKEHLRARLNVDESAKRLNRYLNASVQLMQHLARACGHTHLDQFSINDLTTWKRDIAYLTGASYAGVIPLG